MRIENLNTNITSLERIYTFDIFERYYFNQDHPERNTLEIPGFISNAAITAQDKKYVNWKIEPAYDEGDYDNCSSMGLVAEGYRLETDEEYSRRISSNLTRKKIAYDNWKRMKEFYESGAYAQEIAEMEAVINLLK